MQISAKAGDGAGFQRHATTFSALIDGNHHHQRLNERKTQQQLISEAKKVHIINICSHSITTSSLCWAAICRAVHHKQQK